MLEFFLSVSLVWSAQGPTLQEVCIANYEGLEKILRGSRCDMKIMTEKEKNNCSSILQCKISAELYPEVKLCLDANTRMGAEGDQVTNDQINAYLVSAKKECDTADSYRMKCAYEPGTLQGRPTGADPNTTAEDCLLRTRPLPTGTGTAP